MPSMQLTTAPQVSSLRGMMGSDTYSLYTKTLEIKESNKDNTPSYKANSLPYRDLGKSFDRPRQVPNVTSMQHWFMLYG